MSCAFRCHVSRILVLDWTSEIKTFPAILPRSGAMSHSFLCSLDTHSGHPIGVYGIEINGFKGHKTGTMVLKEV